MDDLQALFNAYGFNIDNDAVQRFYTYEQELREWNKKMNLTRIETSYDIYLKHFLDSLMTMEHYEFSGHRLLDVGSGAGFPSIPLKIVDPSLEVVIVEATKKRVNFMRHLLNRLSLDATVLHVRAENYEKKAHFDYVVARAVSRLNILAELCLPFVIKNGYFIAYKGPAHEEELEEAEHAITTLGGKLEKVSAYHLEEAERVLLHIKKVSASPKTYPRNFKHIKSNPL